MYRFTLGISFIIGLIISLEAQPGNNYKPEILDGAPKIKIDCKQCDYSKMKRSLDFVNFVRDIQSADIYIEVIGQSTGTGQRFTIYFEGQNAYSGINDTLFAMTESDDTVFEKNDILLKYFRQGLLNYLVHSPLKDQISYQIDFKPTSDKVQSEFKDPWNFWVFSINGSVNFDGESNYNSINLRTGIHASRKTQKSKVNFSFNNRYSESNFYFRDESEEIIDSQTIRSFQKSQFFWTGYVYSLDENWSAAVNGSVNSNTFSNYDLSADLEAGLEYNIFPYDESDRRMFVFGYQIGPSFNDYVDTTIYDKISELVWSQSLQVFLSQNQKWGNLSLRSGFTNYLHNFKLNRFTINPRINWNIFKGFTIELSSHLSFISNQINLPKDDAAIPDVLLRDKLLATNYNAYTGLSIRYSFGSQFANVVNPRFWGRGG